MKFSIIWRCVLIVCMVLFTWYTIIHAHGFCEHTRIKQCDVTKTNTIISLCRKATKRKRIHIPSYDNATHTYIQHKKVKKGGQSKVPWYVRISCSNTQQQSIFCSPLQEFYCIDTNTWIPAYQLRVGHRLLSYHSFCEVTCIEYVKKELEVYALEVESPHTFFVGYDELLTHNMTLPTSWIALAPVITLGSGATVSLGSSAVIGTVIAPVLAPIVLGAGLALSGVLQAIVNACCTTIPIYHIAMDGISNLFETNKQDKGQQSIPAKNQPTGTPGGPKKDKKDDNDNEKIKFSENKDDKRHIFRKSEGHFPEDTPESRGMIEEFVNNKDNYSGPDSRGHQWFSKILESGEQLWAKVENNIIKNAGINKVPQQYNPLTGLCKLPKNIKL